MPFGAERIRNSATSIIIRLVVSGLLLAWLLARTHPERMRQTFLNADWALLFLSLMAAFVCVVLQTVRWSAVLGAMGSRIPFLGLFRSNFAGLFFNLFTPSNVGQDAARIIDFRTAGDSLATGFASVMMDRLLGMLAMVIFALAAFPFAAARLPDARAITMVVAGASAGLLAVLVLLCSPAGRPVGRLASRFLPEKVENGLKDVYRLTKQMASRPGMALCAVAAALVLQFVVIVANYVIAAAVGVSISLTVLMLVVPIALIVSSIPISINGVGLREWAYVNLWGAFGVSREQAILSSLAFFFTWVVMGLAGAVVYLTRRQALR